MAKRPRAERLDENEMPDVFDELITTQEAADLLGVTQRHVWHLLNKGAIKGKRFGHDWAVYKPSVLHYKENPPPKGRPPVS